MKWLISIILLCFSAFSIGQTIAYNGNNLIYYLDNKTDFALNPHQGFSYKKIHSGDLIFQNYKDNNSLLTWSKNNINYFTDAKHQQGFDFQAKKLNVIVQKTEEKYAIEIKYHSQNGLFAFSNNAMSLYNLKSGPITINNLSVNKNYNINVSYSKNGLNISFRQANGFHQLDLHDANWLKNNYINKQYDGCTFCDVYVHQLDVQYRGWRISESFSPVIQYSLNSQNGFGLSYTNRVGSLSFFRSFPKGLSLGTNTDFHCWKLNISQNYQF